MKKESPKKAEPVETLVADVMEDDDVLTRCVDAAEIVESLIDGYMQCELFV